MNENLLNVLRLYVSIFDLLGNDVFALTQLENVLLAVDNFKGSVWIPLSNVTFLIKISNHTLFNGGLTDITSMMPAICVYCFSGAFRIFEVSKI